MKDFLSNLATRSLGAAPVIQPRLPSLFEEAMPYALSPAIERPATEQIDQPRRTPSRKGLRNSQASSESQPVDEKPLFVQQPARTSVNRRTESLPSQLQAESTIQPTSAAPVQQVTERASAPPQSLPGERRVELPEIRQKRDYVHDSTPSATVDHSVTQPRSIFPAKATARREASLQLQETIAAASSRPLQQADDFPAQSVVAEPFRLRNNDSAARAIATSEPPRKSHLEFARHIPPLSQVRPAEPSIQVTIGRIEVRAASASASPAKEQKSSPVMSLTDYLQRTRRGGQ
jgi:hypothetical protein